MTDTAEQSGRTGGAVALCAACYLAAAVAAVGVVVALAGEHPLLAAAAADLAATLVVFGFSVAVNNTSMYDPYWSVAPPLIAAYWAFGPGSEGAFWRRLLVIALVGLWGVRLTANWLRRWRGLGHEDWRYAEMRAKTGKAYWLVSLLAFHMMPTVVVFLGCLPLWYATRAAEPLGVLDVVAAVLTLAAIGIETVADEQLARFGRARTDSKQALTSGLWAYCRHPNYLGEILFWWGLFALGLAAGGEGWWTGVGAVAMTLLFVFVSVPLMNRRLSARYPSYRERMTRVPALLPLLLRAKE